MSVAASKSVTESATPEAKVSGIFIYPVKSCRGISLSQAPLTPSGFRWDRQWMVVNSKGRACTQRVEPKLALVEVEFPPEAFDEHWEPTTDSFMVLKAPGMEPLKVCLNKQYEVADDITVWEWTGSAWDEGAEASQWFSDYLGNPTKLVRFNTASEVRKVDPDYVEGQYQTFFSDGYPFLIASQESLDALNELLEEPILMNRFRPNILVEGCEPYSEDLWRDFKISSFSFQGAKLCYRCKIPTINQETAKVGPEPNETLMKYRSGQIIRPNDKNKKRVYFGHDIVWNWMESSAKEDGKVLKLGDPVYVIKKFSSPAEAAA
ncbi:putative molybdenum cofactor sulfurtransferase [Medicago truncatula]|uniref:Mo-molybdopterin cofactor sulfurase n=1 Tax=Medicago truncatula TaxID=3880 RepID=G7INC7_MEDTR|nr:mitochondrial amidoxime reducing component 2 [Medicago truncatula]AES65110.2 Mo-molybdopterin cofactor sulfurase [Medicago truncatula]RHN73292.1 putative molybdenum cofactor sulfurtransferase [Medicago truncatula]